MRNLREALADTIEDSPRECVLGLQIATVAFLVALAGGVIAFFLDLGIGRLIVIAGIIGGFIGGVIFYVGFFNKSHNDKEDLKKYRDRYENPKQPWE